MKKGVLLITLILFLTVNISIAAKAPNKIPTVVPFEPQDTSIIHDQKPRFSWNFYDLDIGDVQEEYEIQIGDVSNLADALIEYKLSKQTFTIINIDGDKTYYWRVRASDGKDWSKWSEIQTFTLDTSIQTCNDGTKYWTCNSKLQYCYGGNLVDNCDYCGCLQGYKCENKVCVEQKCQDGTPEGKCNNDLKLCYNGDLIDDCNKCGCPGNEVCQPNGECKEAEIVSLPVKAGAEESLLDKIIAFIKLIFTF